jgi:hypothetical protein
MGMSLWRAQVKIANVIAARRHKLTDADRVVYAAYQLGGVSRNWVTRRGVLVESWSIGHVDVTQTMMRLRRAGLIEGLHPEIEQLTIRKLARIISRAQKGKS